MVQVTNYRLSPRARLREQLWWVAAMALLYRVIKVNAVRRAIARSTPWIRVASEADFVGDIRGGDSFSDIYGLRNFIIDCVAVLTVIWVRGTIHLFPQTYGPFQSVMAEKIARHILLRAGTILCRDRGSVAEVERITGGLRRGTFCPDVAFELDSIRPEKPQIEPALPSVQASPLIGINVNGLVYHGGYTRSNMFGLKLDYREFLKRAVEQFLADSSAHVLLVPHTFAGPHSVESDPEACREVRAAVSSEVRDRVHIVTAEYDQHRIKGVIGMCDFFVGSRLHACIAALSQEIPTVGVAYSRKFHGVFETVGVEGSVIDGRAEDVESALARVADLYERRLDSRDELRSSVGCARAELRRQFKQLYAA
jgi:polysaccharide pyruvyl transferase WcaK-like protein